MSGRDANVRFYRVLRHLSDFVYIVEAMKQRMGHIQLSWFGPNYDVLILFQELAELAQIERLMARWVVECVSWWPVRRHSRA